MDTIQNRTTTRVFNDQKITEEQIGTLLKDAMSAPSMFNQQPWEFIVIDDAYTLSELSKLNNYTSALESATLCIVPIMKLTNLKFPDYAVQDMSASIENLLLSATDMGISSSWLALYPNQEEMKLVNRILDIPNNFTAFSMIALGYSDEENNSERYLNKTRIHYQKYSQKIKVEVRSNQIALCFENEDIATLNFEKVDDNILRATSTNTKKAYQGQGYANELMLAYVDYLISNDFKTYSSCSYVDNWFKKHPTFKTYFLS